MPGSDLAGDDISEFTRSSGCLLSQNHTLMHPRKTHHAAVAILPPQALWPPIQAIRMRYDRQIRRWMPHINLLYPFRPPEAWLALLQPMAERIQPLLPFTVHLTEIRYFRHPGGRCTLWLAPEPAETLGTLQQALLAVAPECDDVRRFRGGFTPHLSIGQMPDAAACVALQHTLAAQWQPLTFVVTHVSLLWRNAPPDDVFRVGWEVGLEGICPVTPPNIGG